MEQQNASQQDFWRKCTSCKKTIGFRTKYWVCNVSTCNRKRTGLVFCAVSCWDAHVPVMNHRDAWALENMSPSQVEWEAEQREEAAPKPQSEKREEDNMENVTTDSANTANAAADEGEVLVVASKVKAYIRAKSGGMNTSANVLDALSSKIRALCDGAIQNARNDGRKTVMDRDFT